MEHYSVIGSYLKLQISDLNLLYMDEKVRHMHIALMWSTRFKTTVFKSKLQQQQRSPNLSCSPYIVQCSAISQVLEVKMTSMFFPEKIRQFPRTFMSTTSSNSDVSNDVLLRQEDKDFHQVKSWPPTQQLVIKSIVPNFGL